MTFVLRTSGQFSLKVNPIIKIFDPNTCIPFFNISFTTWFATYSPILSFILLPAKMISGLYP